MRFLFCSTYFATFRADSDRRIIACSIVKRSYCTLTQVLLNVIDIKSKEYLSKYFDIVILVFWRRLLTAYHQRLYVSIKYATISKGVYHLMFAFKLWYIFLCFIKELLDLNRQWGYQAIPSLIHKKINQSYTLRNKKETQKL